MGVGDFLRNFYARGYKWMLVIPAIVFIISLVLMSYVPKSIDLKGGTYLTIYTSTNVPKADISSYLAKEFGLKDIDVRYSKGITGNTVEIQYITQQKMLDLKSRITEIKLSAESNREAARQTALAFIQESGEDRAGFESRTFEEISKELDVIYNKAKNAETDKIKIALHNQFGLDTTKTDIKEIGTSLGQSFYNTALKIFLVSLALIVIVVFLFFREFVPSVAIIGAGVMDVVGAVAGMTIFNIPLSLTTIPALLMLIGYSVDTDILLTTKLLKRKEGSLRQRAGDALITGLTMTLATMAAATVMLIVAYIYNITVIYYIAAVLLCGSFVDLIATWLMNAPILLWYLEHKKTKEQ